MVKQYNINIDGKEVTALPGQTILQVARENDIYIPTLCYDDRMEIYGACGLCVVEVEGNPKLVKACATEVGPNMIVHTKSERITESRKTNLELLLSNHRGDCRPPCAKACPAETDCQGYVGLVALGRYREAVELIKEKIPLPASLGRVCPHPCEQECRRGLVEEPISIAAIKRFAGDRDLDQEEPYLPDCAPDSGKKVAVIGGGPYGLSMSYFLRRKGHAVTIFEAMPYAGGMLRYGIPEYRLPKTVLEEEIDLIRAMGVEIRTNTRIGTDVSFESIRNEYDAVCLGIGAWKSTGVRCEGEDTPGVIGGIDFLGKVERNEPFVMGKNVAIVGGGNTAMDACRTAVRLGAETAYNVYRRTRDEMPADAQEIDEAIEEGVIFKNLTNPLKIHAGADGRVAKMTLQVMELGEPDASGRRAPVPVEGKTEDLDVDMVILAIGQAVNPDGIEGVELTRKNGIVYDEHTFMTSLPGVFAGGDCGNDKISIAVEAVADAKKGSDVVDAYLFGETVAYKPEYTVRRTDITEQTFEDRERMCRVAQEQRSSEERKDNFVEVTKGYTAEQAREEASRCLECGCHDYYECKLVDYANQYDVHPERIAGEIHAFEWKDPHPYIVRDPNKCILCGLCVRACDEVMGVGALGLVDRGFDTVVLPALGHRLEESGCISCGQCVSICPTGALQEVLPLAKQIPLKTTTTDTVCGFCSMGCSVKTETCGSLAVKTRPDPDGPVNKGVLCIGGKFGFATALKEENRLKAPQTKDGKEITYHDAFVRTAKAMETAARRYGNDAVAISVSDRMTCEEAYAAKKLADALGAKILNFNTRSCGLTPVLGLSSSPNTIDELAGTEVILAVGFEMEKSHVLRVRLMQAAKAGAKVILVNPKGHEAVHMEFATKTVTTENDLDFLRQVAKAFVEEKKGKEDMEGYEAFVKSLGKGTISDEAAQIAALYGGAKKAMIVFQQNEVSTACAALLADLAVLSGHIGSPRNGILMVKGKNNSEGLTQLGITAGVEALDGVKALLVLGETPPTEWISDVEFLAVVDTHVTPAAEMADVRLPGTAPLHADGSYVNTERRFRETNPALAPDVLFSNTELLCELAGALEIAFPYETVDDIARAMATEYAWYREASDGEVIGGVLTPAKRALLPVEDAAMVDPLPCCDYLTNTIERV